MRYHLEGNVLGLGINGLSNENIYLNYQGKKSDGPFMSMAGNPLAIDKFEKAKDGKFSAAEAAKNFAKGVISPITSMFSSKKNFLVGTGMIAGSAVLLALTGGSAAPLMVMVGIGVGAIQAVGAAKKILSAKNGDDIENAFFDVGAATSTIGLSAIGAKTSLKQANIETDGLKTLGSIKKCITSFNHLTKEIFDVFNSGYYKRNFNNSLKQLSQPGMLSKYSNELYLEGQKGLKQVVNVMKEALPKEFWPYLKARSKSEISIYEKLVKERTLIINEISSIRSNTGVLPEVKKQRIAQLLSEKERMITDPQYAKSKVEDLIGLRLSLDDVGPHNIDKLVNALSDSIKKGDIKIIEIENYVGVNQKYTGKNTPYFSDNHIEIFKEVAPDISVISAVKKAGYTATHLSIKLRKGENFEFQVRGKHVDAFADVEHIPYDLRQNKDIAKGNNQLGVILTKVEKAIKGLNEEDYPKYQKYIYDNYMYAQAKELGKNIEKPVLPQGIDPILSAENLHEVHLQTATFLPGKIRSPFILSSQFPFMAGVESQMIKD